VVALIRPEDDRLHERTDDPYWNESGYFGFMIPEHDIQGAIYVYHRPNMQYTVGGVILWDPSGREIYDCLFHDCGTPHATPEGADMFDIELRNGLKVETLEPLKRFRFTYGLDDASWYLSQGCRLELEYEGFREPHQSMMPAGQQEWGGDPEGAVADGKLVTGHYRQTGRMRGWIELNGEKFDVDSFSMRDRTWGPRKMEKNPRGSWCFCIASEDSFFQVLAVASQPPEEDPVVGAVDPILCGSYLKDGLLGDVNEGKVMITERDPDGSPRGFLVEGVDSYGREFRATGVAKNVLKWIGGYLFLLQWWAQVEWTFDGQTARGEGMDWWPVQHARRFIRSLPEH
jgi:hypothetical protein